MVEKVRVLHVITRMIVGGAQQNTLLTVRGLQKRSGYRVLLASGPSRGPEGELIDGQPDVPFRLLPSLQRDIHPLYDARAAGELMQLIRSWQPDIVHTHSSKAGILGRFCAYHCKVPNIVHTIHGLPFHPYQNHLKYGTFARLEQLAAGVTDRLIAVCEAMKEQALEEGIGTADQYRVVYSGFQTEPFLASASPDRIRRFRERYDLREAQPVLTKIARLAPLKGHPYLFSVLPALMSSFPDMKLLLVGGGTKRERYEEQIEAMNLRDRVVFTGLLPPEQVPIALSASDVLVHVSLREGLPRVLPQALLRSVPVVSMNLDGAPEVIRDGETGWLVPPGNKQKLLAALSEALGDPERAKAMAVEGRRQCRERFSHRTMVDEIDSIYGRLNSNRP